MSKKLRSLLEQLTPAERSGAVLTVRASLSRLTRSPQAMRDEVYSAIIRVADKGDCTDAQTSLLEK